METFWIKGIQLLLSLSILVFIHELGHFMWSRWFKVRVDKFYMFFDTERFALVRWTPKGRKPLPALLSFTLPEGSETEYGIGWIPLGGYCKIAGMVDESMDKEQLAQEPKPWEFRTQPAGKRFMIMVGGVLNNMLLAILIYICMAWHWGKDTVFMRNVADGMAFSEYAQRVGFRNGDVIWSIDGSEAEYSKLANGLLLGSEVTVRRGGELLTVALPDTLGEHFLDRQQELAAFAQFRFPMVVSDLLIDGPAQRAGLMPGDSITAIDGRPTPFADLVSDAIAGRAGDTVAVTLWRSGSEMTLPVVLNADSRLGLSYQRLVPPSCLTHIDYSLLEAIPAGIRRGWEMLYNYVRQFKLVFTPKGAQSLGGFGTMASIFPEAWDWYAFWAMTAFFSVALAFMNILPIPALDGGHIMFLLIEVVTGRKPSDRVLEIAQYVGFGIVIALLIFVNANDIWKFVIKPWIG